MGTSRIILVLLIIFFLAPIAGTMADDHSRSGKHFQERFEHKSGISGSHGRGDHGNETTGQLAIWLLAAANLTVITSVLIKGANKLLPMREETKKWLTEINLAQKKYLSKLHYVLNPGILAVAILHWSLSRCGSTPLPEWGIVSMLVLAGLGILIKFRLAPPKLTRTLYKLHTHPGVIGSIALLLLAGHLAMD